MVTPTPPNDAQREMEQRALRNVRGLVDKMEGLEAIDSRAQKRLLVGIIIGAVVVVGLIVGAVVYISSKYDKGRTIVIDPARLPPVKGGPPK
jgi:hypothetical protein